MIIMEVTPFNPPYFKGEIKRALILRGDLKERPYLKGRS